jgi:uncharacterized membrane protein SpoIIM required for sporulation
MREAKFIEENQKTWQEFEQMLNSKQPKDPEKLGQLFVRLTNDLAYARTFYPNSKTARYLNYLTVKVHQHIYKDRKWDSNKIRFFWSEELPIIFYETRKQIGYAALFFIGATILGWISASYDPGVTRVILGDQYVDMTLNNIESGDPMAVYKGIGQMDFFVYITLNNLYVAFLCFSMGILFTVGTVYILLNNGMMLGCFQQLFHQQNLLGEALATVYLHATLELTAIVVAGGAGMVMGNSLLFPGNRSRLLSLQQGAKRGAAMMAGLVPFFVLAAFIEGFVTRYSGMPLALKLLIIFGSMTFAIWYFVWYPQKVWKIKQAESPDIL